MEDSHDFGWASAKGSHAVLLSKMEEGRKLRKWIRFEELMLTGLPLYLKVFITTKNRVARTNPCHVDITRKSPAHTKGTIKLVEGYIYIYVATVIPRQKHCTFTERLQQNKKTNRALQ